MHAQPFATVAWYFLISVKLAIWIIILPAVTSILSITGVSDGFLLFGRIPRAVRAPQLRGVE
jgi:hypothetical protein